MIIAVRAVVEESRLVAFVTLVHGLVHLAAGGVIIFHAEGLARHQVADRGELAARQGTEADQNLGFGRYPRPVHLPIESAARVRRVDIEGLEGEPILSDILDDVGSPYCKPRSGQLKSLPFGYIQYESS